MTMKKRKENKEKAKTKILAAGDIHGDRGLVRKLAEKAKKENVDLIILAGDITMWEEDTKNLIGPFAKLKKPVLLLHGNHESLATVDFLSEIYSPNTKNIHGYSFLTPNKKVGIFGAGGADFGMSPMTEKDFFKTLNKAHKGVEEAKKTIMVTHMHPSKSKAEFSGFRGSTGITKAIKEFHPDILINAHIHEAGGLREKIGKTEVINVSRNPAIFEI
jgi:Icc-related predicted phosphoesterase